ncbi:aminodeoxychorismate synthase component I [Pontixanthobacter aestiaquae]|uniref:Probable branched-chain-amino-acid aminotransferase n=1 Tax=Pontixanthobacter aestiaquae TaxID=1509367 RepID=A0A844Z4P8_9SPHN|nr:aminodeoxychorismate synthase component I [Pontixanthobacter aestiaquae]MDN3646695.1 aminodeoxychorismate synthase component I [Pontixanthobacter aestiaquae]MXO82322.1 aminodeoxychorismate synthase component I [Pontixanthobacter aestiaquae]
MSDRSAFVLLDDARESGAANAHLFEEPEQIFVARRAEEVADILAQADAARRNSGGTLAGYLAYEAGLALEPKLLPLAEARSGANGPLVWLGLFREERVLAAADVENWLAENGAGDASLGPLEPQISTGGYVKSFEALQDAIRSGDIYQANLTFPLAGSYRGDPVALYSALRPAAKGGYGGLLFDGAHWLLSLSPELFFSLKDHAAKVKPMKGTRPRGQNEFEDKALAEELASSVKDKAENLMIVDLMRNDLSRVAKAGSVQVDAPFAVESYPTVHQMVSTVRASLQDGKGAADLIGAIFPCGSITGAPKIRAMELISEVERDARGAYCGAIGRIDANGDAAFNVAIRTLRLTPIENDQGDAVLGVGSAIVADSDAMQEWRESIVKGGFARQSSLDHSAAQFDLIETMRFDPDTGIDLLELHLERIKTSAAELGFSFDRHATRNQIHALCFELERPAKVRLLAARSGAISLVTTDLLPKREDPVECIALPIPVDPSDWRLRHKTTDRGFYEAARDVAETYRASEALLVRDDGLLTEGSWTSIFVERDGKLLTPPASLGLLPGVMRRSLLESGKAQEAELTLDDLTNGFLLGNAVRGLIPGKLKP